MRPHHIASVLVTALALSACDDDRGPRDYPPPPPPSQTTDLAAALTSAAASASATSSASASGSGSGASIDALVGTWEGSYDAKKGRIDVPSGVKDDARAGDNGKIAAGPGQVRITVAPDGGVTGKSQGALGIASIRGKLDDKMLRASFVPDDPSAPHAMTGVLVGPVKGNVIQAELRVAGPDALLVRQANFELKRKE
jgi:hypothetical protein